MGFFKRATNIATWVLIRDVVRGYMKESAKKELDKDEEKRYQKRKEEEKLNGAKARMKEREKIKEEFDKRWGEMIKERYNESLKMDYWMWWPVERCEIKTWKWEISLDFPDSRLKVIDEWPLTIQRFWFIELEGKVKRFTMKKAEYERYEIYDNGILFYKSKWKNVFLKIHYIWNDRENIECILKWVPYMTEDEDTDYIYQIIDYIETKNFEFESQEIADLLWVDDEEATRLIEKLWKKAWLNYYRDGEKGESELEKMDKKIISDAEKKKKKEKLTWRILGILLWLWVIALCLC